MVTTATAITSPTARLTFPRDAKLRRELLPHSTHGAKMNLHLLRYIIETYTKLDDSILDPMAGCGSILYAAVLGRDVDAIELEPKHVAAIAANHTHLVGMNKGRSLLVHTSDNQYGLRAVSYDQGNAAEWGGLDRAEPDHIVFSPPYGDLATRHRATEANTFNNDNVPSWRKTRQDPGFHVDSYGHEFFQIGSMNYSRHTAAMAIVYRNCYQEIAAGGIMVVVTADWWRAHKRVPYRLHTAELAGAAGFELIDWWQRDRTHQVTSWQNMRRKQGKPTIDEEDVQVFRRSA